MDNNIKIWRYIDMEKFISLIVNETLYFPSAVKFQDPFEGYLPLIHEEKMTSLLAELLNSKTKNLQAEIGYCPIRDSKKIFIESIEKTKRRSGVNCWHMNDHESEAMWKLYANKGIAIESTVGQLKNSLLSESEENKIYIYPVQYNDFESTEIELGHEHHVMAIKRKSFDYEKELRAFILLPTIQEGEGIHVSLLKPLDKITSKSYLYEQPNYNSMKLNIKDEI